MTGTKENARELLGLDVKVGYSNPIEHANSDSAQQAAVAALTSNEP